MEFPPAATTASLAVQGWSPGQLRGPRFLVPATGARIPALSADRFTAFESRVAGLAQVIRDDQFFSHTTAAMLHGIPLPPQHEVGPVHIGAPGGSVRTRRAEVMGHRIRARVDAAHGLPVKSIEDCFVHLGTVLGHDDLVAAADSIVHPSRPRLLTPGDLWEHARSFGRGPGAAAARAAARDCRVGAASRQETRWRLKLIRSGLPEPMLDVEVYDEHGTFVGRLDMCYPDLGLAPEYDGGQHWTMEAQIRRDVDRHEAFQRIRWRLIRIAKHHDVDGGAGILRRIHEEFEQRRQLRAAGTLSLPLGSWRPTPRAVYAEFRRKDHRRGRVRADGGHSMSPADTGEDKG